MRMVRGPWIVAAILGTIAAVTAMAAYKLFWAG